MKLKMDGAELKLRQRSFFFEKRVGKYLEMRGDGDERGGGGGQRRCGGPGAPRQRRQEQRQRRARALRLPEQRRQAATDYTSTSNDMFSLFHLSF